MVGPYLPGNLPFRVQALFFSRKRTKQKRKARGGCTGSSVFVCEKRGLICPGPDLFVHMHNGVLPILFHYFGFILPFPQVLIPKHNPADL